jgi:hypothetical protein
VWKLDLLSFIVVDEIDVVASEEADCSLDKISKQTFKLYII